VPIRDQENIIHSATTISFNSLKLTPEQDINMDTNPIKAMFNLDNNLEVVRGHLLDMNIHRPRFPSHSLNKSKEEYYIQVKQESNRMDENDPTTSSNDFSLEYMTQEGQNHQVSKTADPPLNIRMQGVLTVQPALNHPASKNMFNIQLNYDSNQALDPKSWDDNFHAVLLYGSMEHLTSDTLNIKGSLIRMKKIYFW